jgi:hypothetical protein
MDTQLQIGTQPFPPREDRLWSVSPGVIRGVIHGALENKSNAKKVAFVRGRMMVYQDKSVKQYIQRFEGAVCQSLGDLDPLPEDAKLYFNATVYQENMRRDLDCELLPDLLQSAWLINNDRFIWVKHYERRIDRENPRVEFEIGVLGGTDVRQG